MQNSSITTLLLGSLFLLPNLSWAQKTPKQAGKAVQKIIKKQQTAQQAKKIILPVRQWGLSAQDMPQPSTPVQLILPVRQWGRQAEPAEQLSLLERAELTNRLELLENLRRSLQKDPAIIVKPKFAKQMESLNKLGIQMPQISALPANATEKQKAAYVANLQNCIETALNKAQADIAARLGQQVPALHLEQAVSSNRKDLLLARGRHQQKWAIFQAAAKKHKSSFSWGTPGIDLIEITPLKEANTKNLINQIADAKPSSMGAMLDVVLYDANSSLPQKRALMQHIAGMSELVGYNFVQAYLQTFNQLPAVKNIQAAEYTDYRLLNKYARNTQAELLERQWETKTFMPNNDAKAFTALASFVDHTTSRASMLAVAHGDQKAALWLLRHAPSNVISQKLVHYLFTQYPPRKYGVIFSSNPQKEVVSAPDIPLFDKSTYQNALEARLEVVEQRIANVSREIQALSQQVNNMSANIENAKKTEGTDWNPANTEMQLVYFRTQRAKLDLRITRLKDLAKKLRVEYKEVYGDLQDLQR